MNTPLKDAFDEYYEDIEEMDDDVREVMRAIFFSGAMTMLDLGTNPNESIRLSAVREIKAFAAEIKAIHVIKIAKGH